MTLMPRSKSAPQRRRQALSAGADEPARAAAWLLPACAALLPRAMPFHLVELGASAALALIGDYLPRSTALLAEGGKPAAEPPRWAESPFPVLSRHGLAPRPRRLSSASDLRWLRARIPSQDVQMRSRWDRAMALFERLAVERSGPRLQEVAFADMPSWLVSTLRPHAEEGLLLFNAGGIEALKGPAYAALREGLARALKPWGDAAFWIELEAPRSQQGEPELRAHRWLEGAFQSRILAHGDADARWLRLEPGWDFLRPCAPHSPPRWTIEERPRALQPGIYRFGRAGDPAPRKPGSPMETFP